jgi:hypothetical protein
MSTPPIPQSQPTPQSFAAPASYPSMAERVVYSPPVMAAANFATGNTSTANRAAFWLGLLFPYFGIAVGLAFMMCDDRRRQEVGRICIIWSLVSTVAHIILFFLSAIGMREYFMLAFNTLKSQARKAGGMGGLGGGAGEP